MSMLLAVLITKFFSGIASIIETESTIQKNKQEAKEKGWDSYLDHKGYLHHIDTDIPYRYERDFFSGDTYEVNPYSGKRLRNVSEDYRNKNAKLARELAMRDGRRFYQYEKDNDHHKDDLLNGIRGYRYRDLYSDNEYVKREFVKITGNTTNKYANMVFYLNINTKMFDYAENKYNYNTCSESEFGVALKELNEKQKNMLITGKNEFGHKITMGLDIYHNTNVIENEIDEFFKYGE